MKKTIIVNTVNMVGKKLSDLGSEVSKIVEATGEKPTYLLMDMAQHESALSMEASRVKQGRVIRYKGISVMVTL